MTHNSNSRMRPGGFVYAGVEVGHLLFNYATLLYRGRWIADGNCDDTRSLAYLVAQFLLEYGGDGAFRHAEDWLVAFDAFLRREGVMLDVDAFGRAALVCTIVGGAL